MHRHSSRGFTLIELLVVISIIGILAGMSIPVIGQVRETAKKAQSTAMMHQIKVAVTAYDTEYNLLPVPTDASGEDYKYVEAIKWKQLCIALNGNKNPLDGREATSEISNNREIKFLELSKKDVDNSGTIFDPFYPKQKPEYFVMWLDSDYDQVLEIPRDDACKNLSQTITVNSSIAIYSRAGGTIKTPKPAITSW